MGYASENNTLLCSSLIIPELYERKISLVTGGHIYNVLIAWEESSILKMRCTTKST
jgi:hypothetical protein